MVAAVSKRQKIAVVSHSHPSISKGGAEISAYAVYQGLRRLGHDAIYIGACSDENRANIAFADDREFAVYFDPQQYSHFYHLASNKVTDQLIHILKTEQVEVVNFHHFLHIGINALRVTKRTLGIKCHLTIHEFLAICHHHGQMITKPAHILCQAASNEACVSCFPEQMRNHFELRKQTFVNVMEEMDGYISPSHFLAERFIHWGLTPSKMGVIENGLLSLHVPEKKPVTEDAKIILGFFGQINPFKGVDVILNAVELIAKDKVLSEKVQIRIHGNIIGQSEEFTEKFNKMLKANPFLTYAGAYNTTVVHELMSECDAIIVPSKWWENSPVVIQEAYANQVPLICTGIGGMAEKIVDGVSGLHFRLGDANDLVRAIRKASDRDVLAKLKAGIPKVSAAEDMAQAYIEFFAQH